MPVHLVATVAVEVADRHTVRTHDGPGDDGEGGGAAEPHLAGARPRCVPDDVVPPIAVEIAHEGGEGPGDLGDLGADGAGRADLPERIVRRARRVEERLLGHGSGTGTRCAPEVADDGSVAAGHRPGGAHEIPRRSAEVDPIRRRSGTVHDEIAAPVTVEVTDGRTASGDHRLAVGEQAATAQHLLTGGQLQATVGAAVLGDGDAVGDEEREPLRHRGLGIGLVEQGEGARDVRGGERRPRPAREPAAGDRERARPLPRTGRHQVEARPPVAEQCDVVIEVGRADGDGVRHARREPDPRAAPAVAGRDGGRDPPRRAARRRRRGRRPPRTPATDCCRSARRRSTTVDTERFTAATGSPASTSSRTWSRASTMSARSAKVPCGSNTRIA